MKPLKPTMKERNRYVAFELKCSSKCTREEVAKALWKTLLDLVGECGAAGLSVWLMDWDNDRQKGIIKICHTAVGELRMGLAVLRKVGESNAAVRVLGVGGTLKSMREMLELK